MRSVPSSDRTVSTTQWSLLQKKHHPLQALLGWSLQIFWRLCIKTMTYPIFLEGIHWQRPRGYFTTFGPSTVPFFLDTNCGRMWMQTEKIWVSVYPYSCMEMKVFTIGNPDCWCYLFKGWLATGAPKGPKIWKRNSELLERGYPSTCFALAFKLVCWFWFAPRSGLAEGFCCTCLKWFKKI